MGEGRSTPGSRTTRLYPAGDLRWLDFPPPNFNNKPFAFLSAPPLSSSTHLAGAEDRIARVSAVLSNGARRNLQLWEATRKKLTFCKRARARVQRWKTKRPQRTSLSLFGRHTLHNKSSLGVSLSLKPCSPRIRRHKFTRFWASRALFRVGATHAVCTHRCTHTISPPLSSAAFHSTNQPPRNLLSCELKCPRSAFQFPLCSRLYLIWSVQRVLCLLRIFRLIAHPDSACAEHHFCYKLPRWYLSHGSNAQVLCSTKTEALLPNF